MVVTSSTVAEYKTRYVYSLDAWLFGGIISNGSNVFLLDRRDVSRDMDIGAWNKRWTFLRSRCPERLKDVLGFDMPTIRHLEKVGYLRGLLRVVRNVKATCE